MGQPYIGEIRMVAFSFAPAGWAFCAGQLMPISENDTLFNLIGTTYGGDGESTFGLPNLQGRVPLHMGNGGTGSTYVMGETGGVETVTLTTQQIPAHYHTIQVPAGAGTLAVPSNSATLANEGPSPNSANVYLPYNAGNPQVALGSQTIGPTGGNQPHDNMQPYLAISFIISLYGIYPSPT